MSWYNPFEIEYLESDEYNISFQFDNWIMSKNISESGLLELKEKIEVALGLKKISDEFDCSSKEAEQIKLFWENEWETDLNCKDCNYRLKECYDCVIKCQSPLERELFLQFKNKKIDCILQRRINKEGEFYDFPIEVDLENILTIPDFYIETENQKLCIYADGHYYHERNEYQATRDKNIDRQLQKFGFIVFRYTGKEIRENSKKIVEDIITFIKTN